MSDKSCEVELSLVVPMKDEEESLPLFFARVLPVLTRLVGRFEIVCVDDGSADGTREVVKAQHQADPRIRLITLSRNFGKEAAMTAGLHFAQGRAVVLIDVDLQDPPELIEQMLAKWREGFDVVYATRSSRPEDSLLKRLSAEQFYRVINRMSEVPIPYNAGDFRLMDRRVVEALRQLPERTRFMKGLFATLGFRQAAVHYVRPPRSAGSTKFPFWRLWNFALEGITSFSSAPLRIWSYVGIVISILCLGYGAFIVLLTLFHGRETPGFASLVALITVFGGLQLVSIGVLGEYIARIFLETKRRPIYIVEDLLGFDDPTIEKVRRDVGAASIILSSRDYAHR